MVEGGNENVEPDAIFETDQIFSLDEVMKQPEKPNFMDGLPEEFFKWLESGECFSDEEDEDEDGNLLKIQKSKTEEEKS